MDLRVHYTFLPVDDPDLTVAFYRDILGLEVRQDVKAEGMRWVTMGTKSQPEVNIVLESPNANPDASPDDKQAIADLMAKGVYGRLVFLTDNCDETFERISEAGVDVIQEPIDQPYGVRDCAFRDPSGNMLRFNQPLAR
jgi:predicted enzyme related to lactoylglutathione lyase